MRKIFIKILTKLAEKDKNIYLLTGDLGFSAFEDSAEKFPERFINCGIAEQNMMGVAAGLALSGKKVYVYSIIPFAVFRCFEQLRNDVVYHNLDVKIIGAGAGFSYGTSGSSHFAIEDIAVLRVLPNITILSPGDAVEMEQLVLQSYKTKNPTYIRLGKNVEQLHNPSFKIIIGKPSVLKSGKDGVIITTGSYLKTGINIVKKLAEKGFDFKLISMHTIKPINEKLLIKEIKNNKFLFTIEEHKIIGGLGSIISEILFKNNLSGIILKTIGIPDEYPFITASQEYFKKYYKIDEDGILKQIFKSLKK